MSPSLWKAVLGVAGLSCHVQARDNYWTPVYNSHSSSSSSYKGYKGKGGKGKGKGKGVVPTRKPSHQPTPPPSPAPTTTCALSVEIHCVDAADGFTPCRNIDPELGDCQKAAQLSFTVSNTGTSTLLLTDVDAEVNSEPSIPTNDYPDTLSSRNIVQVTLEDYSFNVCDGSTTVIEVDVSVEGKPQGGGFICEGEDTRLDTIPARRIETPSPTGKSV